MSRGWSANDLGLLQLNCVTREPARDADDDVVVANLDCTAAGQEMTRYRARSGHAHDEAIGRFAGLATSDNRESEKGEGEYAHSHPGPPRASVPEPWSHEQ